MCLRETDSGGDRWTSGATRTGARPLITPMSSVVVDIPICGREQFVRGSVDLHVVLVRSVTECDSSRIRSTMCSVSSPASRRTLRPVPHRERREDLGAGMIALGLVLGRRIAANHR